MRVLSFPVPPVPTMTSGEHLSAADLARYIDRTLSDVARHRTERHLSDCAQCREELAACAPIAWSLPEKRQTRLLVSGLGIAAAAAIAISFAARPKTPVIDATQERGIGAAAPAFVIVTPPPGSTVAGNNIRFTWRADSGAAGYTVIVTTADGSLAWTGQASDTSTVPPASTKFVDGEYYWRVEATRGDGRTARSPTNSFRVVDR